MRTRNIDKERLVKQKAIETIVKYGMEGFSMNKLAKECKISVATLYIYYKDKDDLILKIAEEEGSRMGDVMIDGFDPEMAFADGLRVQWRNRYHHMVANPRLGVFFDQLRTSSYHEEFMKSFKSNFEPVVSRFMENALARGEINKMPFEAYWSVAFAPLYSLIRFHNEGHSIGGMPFTISDEVVWATFDLVVKALSNKD